MKKRTIREKILLRHVLRITNAIIITVYFFAFHFRLLVDSASEVIEEPSITSLTWFWLRLLLNLTIIIGFLGTINRSFIQVTVFAVAMYVYSVLNIFEPKFALISLFQTFVSIVYSVVAIKH